MKSLKRSSRSENSGFTLIELMIALGVLAIIAAIAVPSYFGYITTARVNTMEFNMRSLRTLLEDERLENGVYGAVGTIVGEADITAAYDWEPDSDLSDYAFTLRIVAADDYDLWVVHTPSQTWRRCDNRMRFCCDGTGLTTTACPRP